MLYVNVKVAMTYKEIFCYQDVVEPLLTEQEYIVDSDIPRGSFVPASTSVVHGGNFAVKVDIKFSLVP